MRRRLHNVVQETKDGGALLADGRGLMNRRAFINRLGVVAGGVAFSVSWVSAGMAADNSKVSSVTSRAATANFDDPAFGTPGYADAIPFPKPATHGVALVMDDPLSAIFSV